MSTTDKTISAAPTASNISHFVVAIKGQDGSTHSMHLQLEKGFEGDFWRPYFDQFLEIIKVTARVQGHEVTNAAITD